MSKKTRKTQKKKNKKPQDSPEEEIQEKMNLFNKISNCCLSCEKPFDKLNRADVESFRVVVREKENKVNLYCEECWQRGMSIIKKYHENT